MTRPTEAQHSDTTTSLALVTPDFAEVRYHIAVAQELRAQYMARMIRAAFRALKRALHLAPAHKDGDPKAA